MCGEDLDLSRAGWQGCWAAGFLDLRRFRSLVGLWVSSFPEDLTLAALSALVDVEHFSLTRTV